MVKDGHGELPGDSPGRTCIRDAYLVQKWAKSKGIDLKEMDQERVNFQQWIESHTGQRAVKFDMRVNNTKRWGIIPPGFHGGDPRFLELCAAVKYRARFEDKSVVYLTGCELRPPRPAELKEIQSDAEGNRETLARLAQAQQTLSSGILLNGAGTEKMSKDEILLFNLLREKNPKREGWALSYREIAQRLNISQTEVARRRKELERSYPNLVTFISSARQLNDGRKIDPDYCDSGRQIKTKNPPESPSESD
jgi:DNA-binding MarR family transcriptional regulator